MFITGSWEIVFFNEPPPTTRLAVDLDLPEFSGKIGCNSESEMRGVTRCP